MIGGYICGNKDNLTGSSNNYKYGLSAHELGHTLWLGDLAGTAYKSYLMGEDVDIAKIRTPQSGDLTNLKNLYKNY
jgi:uncharacterized membrane protein YebE (DUF533 family)